MHRKPSLVCLASAALLAPLCAQAVTDAPHPTHTSAAALIERCTEQSAAGQRFCQGYLGAVTDGSGACIPPSISFNTIRELALGTLRDAPDAAGVSAAPLLSRRLIAVFPCQPAPRQPPEAASESRSANSSNKARYGK